MCDSSHRNAIIPMLETVRNWRRLKVSAFSRSIWIAPLTQYQMPKTKGLAEENKYMKPCISEGRKTVFSKKGPGLTQGPQQPHDRSQWNRDVGIARQGSGTPNVAEKEAHHKSRSPPQYQTGNNSHNHPFLLSKQDITLKA